MKFLIAKAIGHSLFLTAEGLCSVAPILGRNELDITLFSMAAIGNTLCHKVLSVFNLGNGRNG
jgi:hypothetical protein